MTQDMEAVAKAVGEHLAVADQKILELLGIEIDSVTPGQAVCRMVVRDDMVNSHGYCHGGLIFTLADTAFAYACSSNNQAGVTLSANTIFSTAAKLGDTLVATARLAVEGGRTGSCDVEVTNQTGEVIARLQGVWYRVKRQIVEAVDPE